MVSTSSLPQIDALAVAAGIAQHLCSTRLEAAGECTWLGWNQHPTERGEIESVYETCGPELYGGTSGIALFLAQAYACTGQPELHRAAEAALNYALARHHEIHPQFRIGFYSGAVGIAYAASVAGRMLSRPQFIESGATILTQLATDPVEGYLLDVISGAAGAIPPLLQLANELRLPVLRDWAERLGDRIIQAAHQSDEGWSWGDDSTGFHSLRPLTGLGHGAAGFGWALLELFHVSGEHRFLRGAEQAFRYEQSWFRDPPGNWPDFRFFDGESEPPPYGLAWCQGAPGIGLTRLRALQIRPMEQYRADVAAALGAVKASLAEGPPPGERDFSLCHGLAGIGDFLLEAAQILPDSEAEAVVQRLAAAGVDRHGTHPDGWLSGVPTGSNPSLMLGLAGVGQFFLRLGGQRSCTILLPGAGALPEAFCSAPKP